MNRYRVTFRRDDGETYRATFPSLSYDEAWKIAKNAFGTVIQIQWLCHLFRKTDPYLTTTTLERDEVDCV